VSGDEKKTIEGFDFQGFGAHDDAYPVPYMTFACAIGMRQEVRLICDTVYDVVYSNTNTFIHVF
jgi:hypothetical protein